MRKGTKLNTVFNTYKVIQKLGEGGNGIVYKIQDLDNGFYAAKIVNQKNLNHEKLKRFKNEINFCEKNNHKNIIKVLDRGLYSDNENNYIFYVMTLYDCSLRELMKSDLSGNEILNIFYSICEGLEFAHNRGCIHRDLKPENILINTNENLAVISDFGIAHFVDNDKITTVKTKESSRLANFTYHAPEQETQKSLTKSTDIFSLGLILNELFTKEVPRGENYRKIAEIDPEYSFLDGIVSKMINQNPAQRFQTINEIKLEISARIKEREESKKISDLQKPILFSEIDDELVNNPIQIKDIDIDGNCLKIELSNVPNRTWCNLYSNSLGNFTFSPVCYKNFTFNDKYATYLFRYRVEAVESLMKDFKQALINTNKLYCEHINRQEEMRKENAIKQRQLEIERIENNRKMREQLKKYL